MHASTTTARHPALRGFAATVAHERPLALETTALAHRSLAMRDVIALLATDGRLLFDELRVAPLDGLDRAWLAALGRVVGLQNARETDDADAIRLLQVSAAHVPGRRLEYLRTLAEVCWRAGDPAQSAQILRRFPEVGERDFGYLLADLSNPFGPLAADPASWPELFGRPFTAFGLSAPVLTADVDAVPFDRLRPAAVEPVDGPLISVVMTTYRPELRPLETSVRSILAQSWRNLELILVDDGSGPEFTDVLDAVAQMDERISVHRLAVNGGTYVARNAGLAAAHGRLVTGQDDDDWSHPERLALQAGPLLEDPSVRLSRSYAMTVDDRLIYQRAGIRPQRPNQSSLMFYREDAVALAGYLRARKGADSEIQARLERWTGTQTLDVRQVLSLVRIRPGSLSRSDFRAGWHHPSRTAFRQDYLDWIERCDPLDLAASGSSARLPFAAPNRFLGPEDRTPAPQVVFGADFREDGADARLMSQWIRALVARGTRVGLLQLPRIASLRHRDVPFSDRFGTLLRSRYVTRVYHDDELTAPLVLADPSSLALLDPDLFTVRATELTIVADSAPGPETAAGGYDVAHVSEVVRAAFGAEPSWFATSTGLRTLLRAADPQTHVLDETMNPVALERWAPDRSYRRADRPVIGILAMHDPEPRFVRRELRARIEPSDGEADVRLWGPRHLRSELARRQVPPRWTVMDPRDVDLWTFLNSIDVLVEPSSYEPGSAPTRATVEALASGLPVIASPAWSCDLHGAIHVDLKDVGAEVARLHARPSRYSSVSARARAGATATAAQRRELPAFLDILAPEPHA